MLLRRHFCQKKKKKPFRGTYKCKFVLRKRWGKYDVLLCALKQYAFAVRIVVLTWHCTGIFLDNIFSVNRCRLALHVRSRVASLERKRCVCSCKMNSSVKHVCAPYPAGFCIYRYLYLSTELKLQRTLGNISLVKRQLHTSNLLLCLFSF